MSHQQIVEVLVVAFDPHRGRGAEVSFERRRRDERLLAAQAHPGRIREVEQVVGLAELLVAGTLRVPPERRPDARGRPRTPRRREPRRHEGLARRADVVDAQTGLQRHRTAEGPGVFHPRAPACRSNLRPQCVRKAGAPLEAGAVDIGVAISEQREVEGRRESVHFSARMQRVRPGGPAQFLPRRQVTNERRVPVAHRRLAHRHVTGRIRAASLVGEQSVEACVDACVRMTDDRHGVPARADGRLEARPPQGVLRLVLKPHVHIVIVDAKITALSAAQSEDRQLAPRARRPRRLGLEVVEAGKGLVADEIGDDIVVGAACAHQPRSAVDPRNGTFDDDVRIRDAQRRLAAKRSACRAITGFDRQQ